MADIVLQTQFVERDAQQRERCLNISLLVYDEQYFSDERLSNDLREQLEEHPTLSRIYVIAPLVTEKNVLQIVEKGTAYLRVSEWTREGAFLSIITAERPLDDGRIQLFENNFIFDVGTQSIECRKENLRNELVEGWLCDLFSKSKAMVLAPAGVHFGKTSGKHSDRFLRAANVLSSSAACRLLALFSLPLISGQRYRKIFVDTLPLVSLGFAILEVGKRLGLTVASGSVFSFGSYDGVQGTSEYQSSDLLIISASTSGGLVDHLLERGASNDSILTLFYLQAKAWPKTKGAILCDLTHGPGKAYGYAEVLSYKHSSCPLCAANSMLAEFEGDQFLLQRRRTKRLKVIKASQPQATRNFYELVTRKEAISVAIVGPGRSRYSDIYFDTKRLLDSIDEARAEMTFKVRRAVPAPLDFIVSDDFTTEQLTQWTSQNGKATIHVTTPLVDSSALDSSTPIFEAGVLVCFGMLHNDFRARSINRALRRAAPRGSITYVVLVLLCESPESRRDLLSFLSYGERGPATFVVEPIYEILLGQRQERSPWDLERDLLAAILEEEQSAPVLQARLNFLQQNSHAVHQVFLDGQRGQLSINDDFVYLNTKINKAAISQADVYAVTSSLLASCRNDNREISKPAARGSEPLVWATSIYGQVLLCPRNFKDYNDGVLHAALLRSASSQELRYDTDASMSAEMLDVILDEIAAWRQGSGQALPEFCLAISTGRLVLKANHLEEYKNSLSRSLGVPRWVKLLAGLSSK
jgi:hypothetical protein